MAYINPYETGMAKPVINIENLFQLVLGFALVVA